MTLFSKAEQTPVNRRRFLAGTAAITAAACIPAAAGDGVALFSASHPETVILARSRIYIGDVVKYIDGSVARCEGWGGIIAGVARDNAEAGQPVELITLDDINHIITEEIEHDSARQNANGFRIASRHRHHRAAPAVLQV